jgi:hypothetical protein
MTYILYLTVLLAQTQLRVIDANIDKMAAPIAINFKVYLNFNNEKLNRVYN